MSTLSGEKSAAVPIPIPKPLYNKIEERIEGTEFTSVTDYVTYVLEQVVSETEEEKEVYSEEDERKIKERLRSLGYL